MVRRLVTMLLILIVGIVVYDRFFHESKFELSNSLSDLLKAFEPGSDLKEKIASLERENENLRGKILRDETLKPDTVKVYSSYPLSNRKEVVIAAGTNLGLKVGDVALYGEGVLVGQIIEVLPETSVVKTIFDSSLELPVRVGNEEVDALLTGGNIITLSLIPKASNVQPGDVVVSASRNLPYGLVLGRIKTVEEVINTQFKETTVEASFNLRDLKYVTIRKFN